MNKPLISVIMSVFDNEKYVADAIDSILNQTFKNFEFIISNDGSTDKSFDIISDFSVSDERIKLLTRTDNKGLPFSLNEMLAISKGQYIARMDADDIAMIDRFEKQLAVLERQKEVDILGGQVILIDDTSNIVKQIKKPLSFSKIKSVADYSCPVNHPTYMVRKEVYAALSGYRELFLYAQDYDFILRAIDSGCVIENMSDDLLYYRAFAKFHPIKKRQKQLFLGRYALKLHKERVRFGSETPQTLEKLKRKKFRFNFLFALSWRLRNKIMRSEVIKKWSPNILFSVLIFLSSALHYEVFNASLRGYLNSRAQK